MTQLAMFRWGGARDVKKPGVVNKTPGLSRDEEEGGHSTRVPFNDDDWEGGNVVCRS